MKEPIPHDVDMGLLGGSHRIEYRLFPHGDYAMSNPESMNWKPILNLQDVSYQCARGWIVGHGGLPGLAKQNPMLEFRIMANES